MKDPRIERSKRHQLLDIITITICAVTRTHRPTTQKANDPAGAWCGVSGADSWVDVAAWGQTKQAWLRQYMELPNGTRSASHDIFSDVFARLKAEQFESAFVSWVQAVTPHLPVGAGVQVTGGQVVALDGKTLRRSHDRRLGQNANHLVSAWATTSHLVLGQVAVDKKSNESTAIPALLEVLELAGCVVTIEAMGTQTEIAQPITCWR